MFGYLQYNKNLERKCKTMKKKRTIIALIAVFALVFAFNVTAFADTPTTNTFTASSVATQYHDIPYFGEHHYVPYGTVISQTYNSTHYTVIYAQTALWEYGEYFEYNSMHPGDLDGIFGPNTASAVRSFQSHCNLSVDGCVGDNTWNALGNCMRNIGWGID